MKGLIRKAQQTCAQQLSIGQKGHTTVCKKKMTVDTIVCLSDELLSCSLFDPSL
jgi:hypothetical protein